MASEIRVDKINSLSGVGTVTLSPTGVDISGITTVQTLKVGTGLTASEDGDVFFTGVCTATTFAGAHSGSGANLTSLPAAQLSGTLPALSAANLTSIPAANVTGTLPAISGANLTGLTAANLTGALPAISAASLTSVPAANIVGLATAGFNRSGGFPQGLNASYARISDNKGSATQGGTFSSGGWRTRDLQTEEEDPDGIVSISSNQFTLQAGTYYISAMACAINVNNHVAKIQNVTDSSTAILGNSNKTLEDNVSTYAHVVGQFTIAAEKVFELQHRSSGTESTHGFGAYHGVDNNIYSIVEIYKRN